MVSSEKINVIHHFRCRINRYKGSLESPSIEVALKKKYDALKDAHPETVAFIANAALGDDQGVSGTDLSALKKPFYKTKINSINNPTNPLEKKYIESEATKENRNFFYSKIAYNNQKDPYFGKGFLIRNKKLSNSEREQKLTQLAQEISKKERDLNHKFSGTVFKEDNNFKRMSVDCFGNIVFTNTPSLIFQKNPYDPLATPEVSFMCALNPNTEIEDKPYRELIAHTLQHPENKIKKLSTTHYGVYPAHDHSEQTPHLLIIPYDKKYKNVFELFTKGTVEEIKDYLIVLEKVANEGPRKEVLEHELFFSDCHKLQKVPFFYTEYVPRQAPENVATAEAHAMLFHTKLQDIQSGKNITPRLRKSFQQRMADIMNKFKKNTSGDMT